MKLFQILNGRCYYHLTNMILPDTTIYYAPNIEFVEAPDYVFEGWGYDENAEGDDRFIRPIAPEGFEYDENSGTFYDPNNLPPETFSLHEPDDKARMEQLEAQIEALTVLLGVSLGAEYSTDEVAQAEEVIASRVAMRGAKTDAIINDETSRKN